MKHTQYLLSFALVAGLAGCGGAYDCKNADVHDTLISAVDDAIVRNQAVVNLTGASDSQRQRAQEMAKDIDVVDIQTVKADKENGRYRCEGKFKYEDYEVPVLYNVNALEASESPFEIQYDSSATTQMAGRLYAYAMDIVVD